MKKVHFLLLAVVLVVVVGATAVFAKQKRPTPPPVAQVVEAPIIVSTPQVHIDDKPVIVLTYHSVEPKPSKKEGAMQLHYRITPEVFEKQMEYLKKNGYTTITFDTLINHLVNKVQIPEKSIVLTFDDGWKNQYTYAVPILKKFGFTGTFFIITKMRTGGYMGWDDLKIMKQDGFEIASHTESHPKLPILSDEKLREEIAGSKKILEEQLGITVTTLAYPYYLHDSRVMDVVKNAGYLGARAGWGKFANDAEHRYEFKSQEVVNNPDPFSNKRLPD